MSRPNPEGSLSGEWLEEELEAEPEEEPRRLCRRCHVMMSQLNRQAAAIKVSNDTFTPASQWGDSKASFDWM